MHYINYNNVNIVYKARNLKRIMNCNKTGTFQTFRKVSKFKKNRIIID